MIAWLIMFETHHLASCIGLPIAICKHHLEQVLAKR